MAGKINGSHFIIGFLLFQKIANKLPVLSSRFGSVLNITNLTHSVTDMFVYLCQLFVQTRLLQSTNPMSFHIWNRDSFFFNGSQIEVVFLRKSDAFKTVTQKSLPVLEVPKFTRYFPFRSWHFSLVFSDWFCMNSLYLTLPKFSQNPRDIGVGTQNKC